MTTWRSKRGKEVNEEQARKYHDNALRRFAEGRKIAILPDWGHGEQQPPQQHPAESHA